MELTAIFGLLSGVILLGWAILSRGDLAGFWDPPSLIIVLGGTFAAVMVSHGKKRLTQIPSALARVFAKKQLETDSIKEQLVNLAQKARREGLLALEDNLQEIEDGFMHQAVQMLVDATPAEQLEEVLEHQIHSAAEQEQRSVTVFRTAGSISPAFGMIGTLIGLIEMLRDLDDPSGVGTGMAVALTTTLYGTLFANMIFIPMANKLEESLEEKVRLRQMIANCVLSIQEGKNPRHIESQLDAFLGQSDSPTEQSDDEEIATETAGQEALSDD